VLRGNDACKTLSIAFRAFWRCEVRWCHAPFPFVVAKSSKIYRAEISDLSADPVALGEITVKFSQSLGEYVEADINAQHRMRYFRSLRFMMLSAR
jgi:hypothetical protein